MKPRASLAFLCCLAVIGLVLFMMTGCSEKEPETVTPPSTTETPSTPTPTIQTVLVWERQGGIAGFCDGLTVTEEGQAHATSCQSGGGEDRGSVTLSSDEKSQLDAWVLQYLPFEREFKDDATADAMTTRIQLFGAGDQQATDAEIQEIIAFAESLYADATRASGAGVDEAAAAAEEAAAFQKAAAYLAQNLGIDVSAVVKTSATAEDWPDTCLGLGAADEACAQVVTPGYRFLVQEAGASYEIRTNSDASSIRYQAMP